MSCDMIEKDKYTEILTCKGVRFMKWGYPHKDYKTRAKSPLLQVWDG